MVVLQSLRTAVSSTGRNPILFAIVAVIGLFQLPSLVAQSMNPLIGSLISLGSSGLLLLVMPFFVGGLIAMASESIDGRTRLQTFIDAGKTNYVSILIVYLGFFAVYMILGVIAVFAVVISVIFLFGAGDPGIGGIAVLAILGLFGFLVYFGIVFFTQFFAHAIVLDTLGAVEGIKQSISTVRQNLLTVFGYNIITGAGGIAIGIPAGVLSLVTTPMPAGQGDAEMPMVLTELPSVGLTGSIALTLVLVGLSALVGGVFVVYSTALYQSIRPAV